MSRRRPPLTVRAPLTARVQSWAQSSTDFPLRRGAAWAVALIVLVMVGGATTLAAHADPASGATGWLSAIDVADRTGIRGSQYEWSIDPGHGFDTTRLWLSLRLMTAWAVAFGATLSAARSRSSPFLSGLPGARPPPSRSPPPAPTRSKPTQARRPRSRPQPRRFR